MINYFNFKKIKDKYLLTNDIGQYVFLENKYFKEMLVKKDVSDEWIRKELIEKNFIYDSSKESFTEINRNAVSSSKEYLFYSTQLFIFVVTTACNHQCKYCQAQNGSDIPNACMNIDVAQKAADIVLKSPTYYAQIEFQGGEPLINFEVIKFVVEYLENSNSGKEFKFSIVSNLTLITEEMIEFIKLHNIGISTSLDGSEEVHNYNRPYKNGKESFEDVCDGINRLKENGIWVGAIETTTKKSLKAYREIIKTYIDMGLNSISLRALTPLGCASKSWDEIGYTPKEFLVFYKEALDYIIELNNSGIRLNEGMARIFLTKILNNNGLNYMELRSPCGAAVGQMAFYHDGLIYTCDEGRMIAEMGDRSFLLGSVDCSYDELMDSKVCKGICASSVLEGLTSCCDCVYQPYCGVCPAINYSLYGDIYERTPHNYRCQIYGGILDIIFNKLMESDENTIKVFRSWLL